MKSRACTTVQAPNGRFAESALGAESSLRRCGRPMPEPAQLVWTQAARRGSYESRSALATALSKRWTVDQVSAQKMQESHVMAAYALRVDGVDLGLPRALHGILRAGRRPYP